jgi:hypothetical protein
MIGNVTGCGLIVGGRSTLSATNKTTFWTKSTWRGLADIIANEVGGSKEATAIYNHATDLYNQGIDNFHQFR